MSIISVASAASVPASSVASLAPIAAVKPTLLPSSPRTAACDASVHMSLCDSDDAAKTSVAAAASTNTNTTAVDDGAAAAFTMHGLSYGAAEPASLAELFAMSPFSAAASPASAASPADSLDSEREYYEALRDARKQLADKLRGALRDLRQERAVKNGLLRKRYQMRNRGHAAGTGPKPTAGTAAASAGGANRADGNNCGGGAARDEEQQWRRGQQQDAMRRAGCATGASTAAGSFSAAAAASAPAPASAPAAAVVVVGAGGPKPKPPPKITPTAIAARISGATTSTGGKKTTGDKAGSHGGWYDGDYAGMCSSPVSEELEFVDEPQHDDDSGAHLVGGHGGVDMVARECRV